MIKLTKNFFDKDIYYCNHLKALPRTYHCPGPTAHLGLDKKSQTVCVIENTGSLEKSETVDTSLTTLAFSINAILKNALSDPIPFIKGPEKLKRFTQNILRFDEKIQRHNDAIDQCWWLSIIHSVANFLTCGWINWKIERIDRKALETLRSTIESHHKAATTLVKLAKVKKIGIQWRQRGQDSKRKRLLLQGKAKFKRSRANKLIQQAFLRFVDPVKYVKHMAELPVPVMSGEKAKRLYQHKKCIGGGGEGAVHEVYDTVVRTTRALKWSLTCNDWTGPTQQQVVNATAYVHDRLSPHVTRVYETLKIPRGSVSEGCKDWYPDKLCKGYVMELLDGDLADYYGKKRFLNEKERVEQKAFLIQLAFTEIILNNKFHVMEDDGDGFVLRNVFFKHLTPQDTFQGKKLMDFQYWKYTISGQDFYVPRPSLLIKLGDYDQWRCYLDKDPQERKPWDLNSIRLDLFFRNPTTLDELKKLFAKPIDPNATILDMGKAE